MDFWFECFVAISKIFIRGRNIMLIYIFRFYTYSNENRKSARVCYIVSTNEKFFTFFFVHNTTLDIPHSSYLFWFLCGAAAWKSVTCNWPSMYQFRISDFIFIFLFVAFWLLLSSMSVVHMVHSFHYSSVPPFSTIKRSNDR